MQINSAFKQPRKSTEEALINKVDNEGDYEDNERDTTPTPTPQRPSISSKPDDLEDLLAQLKSTKLDDSDEEDVNMIINEKLGNPGLLDLSDGPLPATLEPKNNDTEILEAEKEALEQTEIKEVIGTPVQAFLKREKIGLSESGTPADVERIKTGSEPPVPPAKNDENEDVKRDAEVVDNIKKHLFDSPIVVKVQDDQDRSEMVQEPVKTLNLLDLSSFESSESVQKEAEIVENITGNNEKTIECPESDVSGKAIGNPENIQKEVESSEIVNKNLENNQLEQEKLENDGKEAEEDKNAMEEDKKPETFDKDTENLEKNQNEPVLRENDPKEEENIEKTLETSQSLEKTQKEFEKAENVHIESEKAENAMEMENLMGTPIHSGIKKEAILENISAKGTPADIEPIKKLDMPPTPPCKNEIISQNVEDADTIKKHLFDSPAPSVPIPMTDVQDASKDLTKETFETFNEQIEVPQASVETAMSEESKINLTETVEVANHSESINEKSETKLIETENLIEPVGEQLKNEMVLENDKPIHEETTPEDSVQELDIKNEASEDIMESQENIPSIPNLEQKEKMENTESKEESVNKSIINNLETSNIEKISVDNPAQDDLSIDKPVLITETQNESLNVLISSEQAEELISEKNAEQVSSSEILDVSNSIKNETFDSHPVSDLNNEISAALTTSQQVSEQVLVNQEKAVICVKTNLPETENSEHLIKTCENENDTRTANLLDLSNPLLPLAVTQQSDKEETTVQDDKESSIRQVLKESSQDLSPNLSDNISATPLEEDSMGNKVQTPSKTKFFKDKTPKSLNKSLKKDVFEATNTADDVTNAPMQALKNQQPLSDETSLEISCNEAKQSSLEQPQALKDTELKIDITAEHVNKSVVDMKESNLMNNTTPNKPTAIVKPEMKEEIKESVKESVDSEDKPKKKPLPPKPWLKKRRKPVKKEENEDNVPKPAGYNMDFLDNLDDPNFNPFATKANVVNDGEEQPISKPKSGGYNLDFLDNLDDPNFNPFETKTKVTNAISVEKNVIEIEPTKEIIEEKIVEKVLDEPSKEDSFIPEPEELPPLEFFSKPPKSEEKELPEPIVVKDSTPEFETVEKQICEEILDLNSKFEDTENIEDGILNLDDKIDDFDEPNFLLSAPKIDSKVDSQSNQIADLPNFTLENPAKSEILISETPKIEPKLQTPKIDAELQTPIEPTNQPGCDESTPEVKKSINQLQSINVQKFQSPSSSGPRILSDKVREELARNELFYQAQLLEKDKELHQKEKEIQLIDQEVQKLKLEVRSLSDGNVEMM